MTIILLVLLIHYNMNNIVLNNITEIPQLKKKYKKLYNNV